MAKKERLEWFPFYVDDFLHSTDVALMTLGEKGLYITLLCLQWSFDKGLPNDNRTLANLVGMPLRDFNVAWRKVKGKFEVTDRNTLANPRLESVRQEQIAKAKAKSEKAAASVKHRWDKANKPYVRNTSDIPLEENRIEEKIPTYTTPTNGGGAVKPWELDSKPDDPPQADVVEFMEGYRKSFESITKGKLPLVWSWNDTVAAKEVLKTWPMSEVAKDGRPRVLHMVDYFLMNPAHGTLLRNIKAFKANAPTYDGKMRERGL